MLVGWIGAWLVLGGVIERGVERAQQAAYDASASMGFAVNDILVEGRVHTDPDVLRALVNMERGDAILAFDPAAAKAMIEQISWVREAHVERRLPDVIYIGLIERKPLALWQHQGRVRLIDADGVVLSDRDLAPFRDLMLVVGEKAPDHAAALALLLGAEPSIYEQVEAATLVGGRRWDLKMKNGVTVRLPEADVALALRRLARAQAEDGLLDKELDMVDLRDAGRITVRTQPGAVQDYKASWAGGNNI